MIDKNDKPKKPDPLDFLVAELKHKTKVRDALKESIYGKNDKQLSKNKAN